MKIKNILNSLLLEEQELKQLNKIFQSKYRTDIPRNSLLYRGVMDPVTNDWDIRRIRKNRKPKDTQPFLDMLIDDIEDIGYPKAPKRRESKFAATSRSIASQYGDIYLTFPDRSAKVVSLPYDAYNYFEFVQDMLMDIADEFYYINDDPSHETGVDMIDRFLKNLTKLVYEQDLDSSEKIADMIVNHVEELIMVVEDYVKTESPGSLLEYLDDVIRKIESYFQDMSYNDFYPGADEVIYDGDTYLLIEEDFFFKNYEWDGSNWKLKTG